MAYTVKTLLAAITARRKLLQQYPYKPVAVSSSEAQQVGVAVLSLLDSIYPEFSKSHEILCSAVDITLIPALLTDPALPQIFKDLLIKRLQED